MKDLKFGIIGGSRGMGSWLVKFLRENGISATFSSDDDQSEQTSNYALIAACDVVVLAVPIAIMEDVMGEIYQDLDGKILMDVSSVKQFLIEKYQALKKEHLQIKAQYISVHPMFSQSITSLEGQVFTFTYQDNADAAFVKDFKHLLSEHKATLHDIDYISHDKLMGVIQGLNHFNLFVSAKTLARFAPNLDVVKNLSSPTYRIFIIFLTRYALQNPRLYADIQMYNRYVRKVIEMFRDEVDHLMQLIEQKDRAGFENYVKEMQPFFEGNKDDSLLSDYLIQQLGVYLDGNKSGIQ
ncbi:MAG: prephenate dehydrogenase/arogenate dehydrogenase family protein [Bacteroidetes bacterium]|nr:prephenate dehydrogenase/arogenate dehydrogenase family protein [Bacteroidota bacterium]MDA1121246.1 prephenate dehydrogenase/arogenate dehydrogenase family protein [Bacteroidota bacterium]